MKIVAVIVVATLFSFPSTSISTEKRPAPHYRAESSVYVIDGKDTTTYVTENRSFRFADVLGDEGKNYELGLLLEETYHNEHTDGMDEVRGNATIKAWTIQSGRPRKLRWAFKENGNQGEVRDRFFRITAWGCCDAPTIYSYYSILTGRKLYVSNSDLLEIWGDGDGPQAWRYVAFGYADIHDSSRPPQLQYGTDKKIAQRFSVVSLREYYDAPQVFVASKEKVQKSLDLRDSPMEFTIVLKYQDGVELRVPVEEDAMRADLAQLPKGYSLRAEE